MYLKLTEGGLIREVPVLAKKASSATTVAAANTRLTATTNAPKSGRDDSMAVRPSCVKRSEVAQALSVAHYVLPTWAGQVVVTSAARLDSEQLRVRVPVPQERTLDEHRSLRARQIQILVAIAVEVRHDHPRLLAGKGSRSRLERNAFAFRRTAKAVRPTSCVTVVLPSSSGVAKADARLRAGRCELLNGEPRPTDLADLFGSRNRDLRPHDEEAPIAELRN